MDGNEIKHYKLDGMVDSRDNIQSSTTMMCDKEGIVWVALKNGKIYAYNKLTDSFQLRVDLADYLPSPVLYNMLFDDENRLWLCMSKGLYSWEESAGLSFAGLKGQSVRCMVQMEDEVFFCRHRQGCLPADEAGAQVLRLLRRGRLTCIQRCMWNRSMSSERSCSSVPFQTAYLCLTVPKANTFLEY